MNLDLSPNQEKEHLKIKSVLVFSCFNSEGSKNKPIHQDKRWLSLFLLNAEKHGMLFHMFLS